MKRKPRARPDASSPIQCAPARTRPPLSNLVRRATELRLISLASIAQLAALQLGVAAWQCPCFALTRLPCPGCGLFAFIMGWAKSSDHDTVSIMTTWTGSIVVGLLCRWAGS